MREAGPPVIAVNDQMSESAALEAFVCGAADCVTVGPEFAEVLPVVALEQIQRWRRTTERGAAERRIRDLERYNENIIQNLNSALLVVDNTGAITTCNPPAEQVLGESEATLLGRSLWDWFAGVDSGEIHVARTLSTGERFKGSESVITRSDGTEVPIGISCAPIIDASGKRLGAVAVFSDLTEIKQLQRQFLQTEKMASIGQLAAGVAHEINNPMGFIHSNLFRIAEYVEQTAGLIRHYLDLEAALVKGDEGRLATVREKLATLRNEMDLKFILKDFGFYEEMTFSAINGPVANRGGTYQQNGWVLFYEQRVYFGEGPTKNGLVHAENGLWMHLTTLAQQQGPYSNKGPISAPPAPKQIPPQPASMSIVKQVSVPQGSSRSQRWR